MASPPIWCTSTTCAQPTCPGIKPHASPNSPMSSRVFFAWDGPFPYALGITRVSSPSVEIRQHIYRSFIILPQLHIQGRLM